MRKQRHKMTGSVPYSLSFSHSLSAYGFLTMVQTLVFEEHNPNSGSFTFRCYPQCDYYFNGFWRMATVIFSCNSNASHDGLEGAGATWSTLWNFYLPGRGLLKNCTLALSKFSNKFGLLTEYEFGFCKNTFSDTALPTQNWFILEIVSQTKHFCVPFVNFMKGFDFLTDSILLEKLYAYGFRGVVLDLLTSYLGQGNSPSKLRVFRRT